MTQFLAFLGVSAVVIVTPGPDTALTIRNTLLGTRRTGVATAFGVVTGQALWTIAASAGIAALLVASEPAFVAVKFAGAAYLVFLGGQALWHAVRRGGDPHQARGGASRRRDLRPKTAYRQGLLSDLGNPKMAVFFASLLPQFAPGGPAAFGTLLLLGGVFAAMTFGWLALYATVVARAGDLLRRPRVRRAVEGVTGALLLGLGARIAVGP
jgi:threonine/homoserine/homoserine lactone efflux protein